MMRWLKARLHCAMQGHALHFMENIYGDRINMLNARSIWICTKCGKCEYRKELHQGLSHDHQ